eukprot:m.88871 g.88871  ORF g.88871 m.88871 type:complete len:459 (-) comp8817_c0_seq3:602-1978(-)
MNSVPQEIFWKNILPLLSRGDVGNLIQAIHLPVVGHNKKMHAAWLGLAKFRENYHPKAVELHLLFKMKKDYTPEELWEFVELASSKHHYVAVQLLLQNYNVPMHPRTRIPVLLTAAVLDNAALVKLICERMTYTLQGLRVLNNYLLRQVCENGCMNVLNYLLSSYNFQSRDIRACYNASIRCAAANGHLDVLEKIVAHFKLNSKDLLYHEAYALREAGANGHAHVLDYCLLTFPDITISDLAGGNGFLFRYIYLHRHFHVLEVIEKKFGRDAILDIITQIPSMTSTCPSKPAKLNPSRASRADALKKRHDSLKLINRTISPQIEAEPEERDPIKCNTNNALKDSMANMKIKITNHAQTSTRYRQRHAALANNNKYKNKSDAANVQCGGKWSRQTPSVDLIDEVEEELDTTSCIIDCTSVCLPLSPNETIVHSRHANQMVRFLFPSYSDPFPSPVIMTG